MKVISRGERTGFQLFTRSSLWAWLCICCIFSVGSNRVLSSLNARAVYTTGSHKPGVYRRSEWAWPNTWGLFCRKTSRVGRDRPAAVVLGGPAAAADTCLQRFQQTSLFDWVLVKRLPFYCCGVFFVRPSAHTRPLQRRSALAAKHTADGEAVLMTTHVALDPLVPAPDSMSWGVSESRHRGKELVYRKKAEKYRRAEGFVVAVCENGRATKTVLGLALAAETLAPDVNSTEYEVEKSVQLLLQHR